MIIYILVQTISVGNPLNQDGYCSRLSFTSTEGFVTNVNIKRKVNVRNITITNHVTEIVWITPAPTTTTSSTTIDPVMLNVITKNAINNEVLANVPVNYTLSNMHTHMPSMTEDTIITNNNGQGEIYPRYF